MVSLVSVSLSPLSFFCCPPNMCADRSLVSIPLIGVPASLAIAYVLVCYKSLEAHSTNTT